MWRRILNEPGGGKPGTAAEAALEALELARSESADEVVQAAVNRLGLVQLEALADDDARIAFWVNVYNALLRHLLRTLRPRGSVVTNLLLFERAVWWVGGHRLCLNDLEHGILRRNQRPLPLWPRPFAESDARLALRVARLDPRVHFALNCGAVSCPPIRAFTAGGLEGQLDLATRSYLAQHTQVDVARGVVTLSRLLRLYAKDFGTAADAVRFTARHLDGPDARWLEAKALSVRVQYGPYDWTLSDERAEAFTSS